MPESPAIEVHHLAMQYPTGKRAGKSTTVEILEGHRSRTGGDVRVLGHDPAKTSRSHNARIGIVLQSSAESPNVTVAEQLNHSPSSTRSTATPTTRCGRPG